MLVHLLWSLKQSSILRVKVKSLQFIWRSGTHRFHPWVPNPDITKTTGPQSSTGKTSRRPTKTVIVVVLLSGKKNPCGGPLYRESNVRKIRSCKTVGGPVKPGFFTFLQVLRSGKSLKVFVMTANLQPSRWYFTRKNEKIMHVYTCSLYIDPYLKEHILCIFPSNFLEKHCKPLISLLFFHHPLVFYHHTLSLFSSFKSIFAIFHWYFFIMHWSFSSFNQIHSSLCYCWVFPSSVGLFHNFHNPLWSVFIIDGCLLSPKAIKFNHSLTHPLIIDGLLLLITGHNLHGILCDRSRLWTWLIFSFSPAERRGGHPLPQLPPVSILHVETIAQDSPQK